MMRIWTDADRFITLKGSPDWSARWNHPFVTGEDYRGRKVAVAVAHIVMFEEVDDQ